MRMEPTSSGTHPARRTVRVSPAPPDHAGVCERVAAKIGRGKRPVSRLVGVGPFGKNLRRRGCVGGHRSDEGEVGWGQMNRRASHLLASWRTGLSRPVLILQAGNAVSYFGYGLVLPFEIIYLHQIRGFPTSTAGLVLAATMG